MPNHELPLDAALQQQYDYLAHAQALDPRNKTGLAPPPESFTTIYPPIYDGVIENVTGLARCIRHQIYALGYHAYNEGGFSAANLRSDTAADLAHRAGLLAILTMPDNHAQRADRAEVLEMALSALQPRHPMDHQSVLTQVATFRGQPLHRDRKLFAVPDKTPPLSNYGTLIIDYDEPLASRRRTSSEALLIDFFYVNELAKTTDPATA